MLRCAIVASMLLISSPAMAQPQCSASASEVVAAVYQQVLERPPDAGSAPFASALESGQMTVRDIVHAVGRSQEHIERFFWPPVVVGVYRQLLQRDPSPQEVQIATADFARGAGSLDAFVASTATRAVNNRPDAVRMLYQRLLGREPDAEGLQHHTQTASTVGVNSVALSIVRSDEYQRRTDGNVALYEPGVRTLFRHVLGGDPHAQYVRQASQIASTYGVPAVVDRIVNLPEYQQRYGPHTVPGRDGRQFCGVDGNPRRAIPRAPGAVPRRSPDARAGGQGR